MDNIVVTLAAALFTVAAIAVIAWFAGEMMQA